MTLIVATVVSIVTGCNDPDEVGLNLLSKFALPVSPSFLSFRRFSRKFSTLTPANTPTDTAGDIEIVQLDRSHLNEKTNDLMEEKIPLKHNSSC